MKRRTWLGFGAAAFLAYLAMPVAEGGEKYDVCHLDDEGMHTIRVSVNAVDKHIANHGDLVGLCNEVCDDVCFDGNFCTQDCNRDTDPPSCYADPRPPVDCDDGDPCTLDECDPTTGCVNTPLLQPRAATHALWCFEEGAGDTVANEIPGGPPITGASSTTWLPEGGVDLTPTSELEVLDHPTIDPTLDWTVEVSLIRSAGEGGPLVWRLSIPWSCTAAGSHVFVRFSLATDGHLAMEVGHNWSGEYSGWEAGTGPGVVPTGTLVTVAAHKAVDGTLTLLVDGVPQPIAWTKGTPKSLDVGKEEHWYIGSPGPIANTQCFPSGQPSFPGVIRAVAIHDD